jgi:hypothetical protein
LTKKRFKVIEMVGILKVFLFTALWGCGNGFSVHSAVWLDSYHNRLGKKKPEQSE